MISFESAPAIPPATFLSGDISFINSFMNRLRKSVLYVLEYVVADRHIIAKYALENGIMEKLDEEEPLPITTEAFDWYPENTSRKVYQAFIVNRNPANNRKDFTIYCTD